MKAIYLYFIAFLLLGNISFGQSDQAEAWLEKAKVYMEKADPLYAEFLLTISFPEEEPQEQKGNLLYSDKKMRVEMGEMLIVSDGKTKWTYMKPYNEVQIEKAENLEFEIGNFEKWISTYSDIDYTYDMTGEEVYRDIPVVNIEFKPEDQTSSFSKARVRIAKADGRPVAFEAFEKSGANYTLVIEKLDRFTGNLSGQFTFNPDEYPDIYVEDLRID